MGFEKGNMYGKYTKRGKGKKTIIFESLEKLNKIGITLWQQVKSLNLILKVLKTSSATFKKVLNSK